MSNEDIKNEILSRTDIVEIISEYVRLTKRGRNFVGLCPFHTERTPSFTVSPDKQIYKCFGCGKSGNAITFLIEHNNLSYIEALTFLGNKYGVKVDLKEHKQEDTTKIQDIYSVLKESANYFNSLLETQSGKNCNEYFEARGFNKKTIKEYQLGYSPNSFDELSKHLKKKGFSEEIIHLAGLTVESESGKLYDRFRNRAMFPIFDIFGRVIAFGARLLEDEKTQAKYINSPQTLVYDKSKVLYGLFQAKNKIISNNSAILVEGYADVLTLHQNGITNSVASSGTSLTVEQLKLLSRYTKNLIIMYDSDSAGQNASERAIELALGQGFYPKIVVLPAGEDPDSILRNNGYKTFLRSLENSIDFIQFLFDKYKNTDKFSSASGKSEIIKIIIKNINLIPDPLQQEFLMQELAVKLDFNETQAKTLYEIKRKIKPNEVVSFKRNESEITLNNPQNSEPEIDFEKKCQNLIKKINNSEYVLLSLILKDETNFSYFKNINFNKNLIITEISSKLIDFITNYNSLSSLLFSLNNEDVNPYLKSILITLSLNNESPSENWEKYYEEDIEYNPQKSFQIVLLKLELEKIEIEIKEFQKLLKNDLSEFEQLSTLETIKNLLKKREEIKDKLMNS
ncbi:MAG: DNA primase [Candidatus Kapaibacteriota bacterium]